MIASRRRIATAAIAACLGLSTAAAYADPNQYKYYFNDSDDVWSRSAWNDLITWYKLGENPYSPTYLYMASLAVRYKSAMPYMIAHRGLVVLRDGITENSLDAVINATIHNIPLVEIDVQATKDGVPMAFHDNSLKRTLGLSGNVADYAYWQLYNQDLLISNPDGTTSPAANFFCDGVGHKVLSLGDLFLYTRGGVTRGPTKSPTGCNGHPEVTFFFDPKNLHSGIATAQFLAGTTSDGKQVGFMKVYPNYWIGANQQPADSAKNLYVASGIKPGVVIVVPVINVRKLLDQGHTIEAMQYADAIIKAYGQYFEIQAIELPGAWDQQWADFVYTYADHLEKPEIRAALKYNNFGGYYYAPRISTGYRFPDFKDGDVPYDWNMDGGANVDKVNEKRGIVGALAKFSCCVQLLDDPATRVVEGSGYHMPASYVTTDYPVQEIWARSYKKTATIKGAPQSNFSSSVTENIGTEAWLYGSIWGNKWQIWNGDQDEDPAQL